MAEVERVQVEIVKMVGIVRMLAYIAVYYNQARNQEYFRAGDVSENNDTSVTI